jgi:hypothetical protein
VGGSRILNSILVSSRVNTAVISPDTVDPLTWSSSGSHLLRGRERERGGREVKKEGEREKGEERGEVGVRQGMNDIEGEWKEEGSEGNQERGREEGREGSQGV